LDVNEEKQEILLVTVDELKVILIQYMEMMQQRQ
jgi:hypothetical protein